MHNHFAVTDIFQAIVKEDDKTKFTWPMEQNICTGACTEVSDTYRCVLFIGPLDGRCEICGETFIDGLIRGGDIRCQDCLHMEPLETQATQVVNVKSC